MPSPKPAILKAAEECQQAADDIRNGRMAADAAAVEKLALALASGLRSLAATYHS